MRDFSGKIAVITGGGSGMGRALARLLAAEGCSVAMCDVCESDMQESTDLAMSRAPQGVRVTGFPADVGQEKQLIAFAEDTAARHGSDHVHLLFNNAAIGGGGSFITSARQNWERTFNVCWYGVYYTTRVFLPFLSRADEAHIVNTSSVNGFWACFGTDTPHTAYSAAKFAVKGFTEALVTDLRVNAPHIRASVVMPGHIGTAIVDNTMREFGAGNDPFGTTGMTEDEARALAGKFRDNALTTADEAAAIILDGVRENRWRILVGPDAHALDRAVRENPEAAYEPGFGEKILETVRRWNS